MTAEPGTQGDTRLSKRKPCIKGLGVASYLPGEFCAGHPFQSRRHLSTSFATAAAIRSIPWVTWTQSPAQACGGLLVCLWALRIPSFILDSPNHKSHPALVPTSPASKASPFFLQAWWLNTQFHRERSGVDVDVALLSNSRSA